MLTCRTCNQSFFGVTEMPSHICNESIRINQSKLAGALRTKKNIDRSNKRANRRLITNFKNQSNPNHSPNSAFTEVNSIDNTRFTELKISKKNKKKKAYKNKIKQLSKEIERLLKVEKDLKKKLDESKCKYKPHPFYDSREWQDLRYKAIRAYGRKCMCCGAVDAIFHIDHIKPRSLYPALELDFNNLQILCAACNIGKSNTDCIDYRPHKKNAT
jgi:5-methylcytosine-specific restriction endonuclease McrA